jgi:hypothetical protein
VRRDGHWFHARTHTGGWVHVEPAVVPRTLLALSPGAYRHYRREVKEERKEERREDRREDRRERKHGKH